jgi:hypothetical protein
LKRPKRAPVSIGSGRPAQRDQRKQDHELRVGGQHRAVEVQQQRAGNRQRGGEKPKEPIVSDHQSPGGELMDQNQRSEYEIKRQKFAEKRQIKPLHK